MKTYLYIKFLFLFLIFAFSSCFRKEEIYTDSIGNNSTGAVKTYRDNYKGTYAVNCSFVSKSTFSDYSSTDYGSGSVLLETNVSGSELKIVSLYSSSSELNSSSSGKRGLYGKATINIKEDGKFTIPNQKISIYRFAGSGSITPDGEINYTYSINTDGGTEDKCTCSGSR